MGGGRVEFEWAGSEGRNNDLKDFDERTVATMLSCDLSWQLFNGK